MKEKGIEDAFNAVMAVNESLGYQAFSLDIYGQIDPTQRDSILMSTADDANI